MATLRRDLLILAGGAGAGLAFSPAPWRLIADSALWSQNWSWIPKTPRGEISYKPTACELCPAGCAVRATLCGAQPVSLWATPQGEKTEPLCPAGLCGHHLAFHPNRLRTNLRGGDPCAENEPLQAALKSITGAAQPGAVAVLDLRPGRTASLLYRKHLKKLGGQYLTLTPALGPTLQSIAAITAGPAVPAFDLENVEILLSIGTPVLEAWDAPGRMLNPNRKFRLWHAEALETATALAADRWFRIRPNSETAFAAGLVAAIDGDAASLQQAASITGIDASELTAIAGDLAKSNAVAVADLHPVLGAPANETIRAVACLNSRLGAIGRKGGIIGRRETPLPATWGPLAPERPLDSVPNGSLSLLFIDDAMPGAPLHWRRIAAKLAPKAVVVAATWCTNGLARLADYALPAISYLEGLHDVPTPPGSASARFALALPLVTLASKAIEPVEWFGRLVGDETKLEERLKERARAIYLSKRGDMHFPAGDSVRSVSIKTEAEFWAAATAGGRWQDDAANLALKVNQTPQPPFSIAAGATGLQLLPTAWMGADVSPLMTKLWIESSLKPRMQQVFMHPDTVRQLGLEPGARARITSSCGECIVQVSLDGAVPPGVFQMAAGQAWFALCEERDGAWRAELREVVRV